MTPSGDQTMPLAGSLRRAWTATTPGPTASTIAAKAFDRSGDLGVGTIQKMPEWRAVMSFAKDLAAELKRRGEHAGGG